MRQVAAGVEKTGLGDCLDSGEEEGEPVLGKGRHQMNSVVQVIYPPKRKKCADTIPCC